MTKLSLTITGTSAMLAKMLEAMSDVIDDEMASTSDSEDGETLTVTPDAETPVDADRMPYDAAIHSDPPSLTDKGTWRVKRGMAKQAEDARAKWKAQGGAIVPPTSVVAEQRAADPAPTVTVLMPGVPAPKPNMMEAMYPGIMTPRAPEPVLPPPVSVDDFLFVVTKAVNENKIAGEALQALYIKHGVTSMDILETNETLRRALYNDIVTAAGFAAA